MPATAFAIDVARGRSHADERLYPLVFRHSARRRRAGRRQERFVGATVLYAVQGRRAADAWERLHQFLDKLDKRRVDLLAKRAAAARKLVYHATHSDELRQEPLRAYRKLEADYGANVAVAVRSSATAEDLPSASFAGQHDSFFDVRGADALFEACRRCFASIFTDRAISYRIDNGFDHFKVGLSVGVMKMVRADRAASGVMFTLDITGVYGLGENIVQGTVDPDEFYVHKPTFRAGCRAVLSRSLGSKQLRMVYARGGGTTNLTVPKAQRRTLLPQRRRGARARSGCDQDRGPLFEQRWSSDAYGHRIGQGPRRRKALHYSGAARDRRVAARSDHGVRDLYARRLRGGAGGGPGGLREDRQWAGAGHCRRAPTG